METTTEAITQLDSYDLERFRFAALAKHLGLDNDGLDELEAEKYVESCFNYGREQYLVLTDEEADETARNELIGSLWAFSPTFLSRYVPALREARIAKAWGEVVARLCEDVNPLVEGLLGTRLEEALNDAINTDGRGHFLARYDGAEYDVSVEGVTFYVYRTN